VKPLVILGSGLAGYTVAREFRKLDATRPIILITSDKGDFYSKPALSNALSQKRTVPSLVTTPAAKMAEQLSLTLLTEVTVTGLDTSTQTVHTSVGAVVYEDLVLALGASAVRAPLAGSAAGEVMSVNSLEDYAEFRSRLEGKRRVLVVGAGLIGCEFANDLALGGFEPVVVAPASEALSTLLPTEASKRLQAELERVGVTWKLGTTVAALDHAGDGLQATLSSGERLKVDVAISAIGLQPNTALARDAGLPIERGILVDRYARTSEITSLHWETVHSTWKASCRLYSR
jgi:rubredoxin-NAD+ reductase